MAYEKDLDDVITENIFSKDLIKKFKIIDDYLYFVDLEGNIISKIGWYMGEEE